ncbi:hypothetical protein [Pseudomonas jessenii]|nr:hypothetical protein [Pseudomonas jessenii]
MNKALVGAGLLAMQTPRCIGNTAVLCIASKPAPTGLCVEVWNHG